MTSPISALFSFGGTPGHMRREEMITATNAQAQEAQQATEMANIAKAAQPQPPSAPATAPVGPTAQPGAAQGFLSNAAAAAPQQNLATKTLLGA